jgi:histidinol-phosphate aminotransferase
MPFKKIIMDTLESKMRALTRPNIRALKPYSSARDEAPETSQIPRIMLDANENSFGGPLEEDFSRYPDPQQRLLKQSIASLKGLEPGQIFLGNGSDEAIDLLFRAFVEPRQDHIIILPPTYGMYAVQANIHGAAIRPAPLKPDFSPDADVVRKATDEHSKILFLCSPNNPTGQCLPEGFILEMLDFFPGLVVVDEAYADFSGNASWISRLQDHPNLVVLQTLSKAWGLAGLRIGLAYAHPLIIEVLNKIKYPYNLNEVTLRLGLEALSKSEKVAEKVEQILAERRRLEIELPRLAVVEQVFPSDSNFLLLRVKDADGLYQYLAKNGIIVRNRSRELHCENCLRITVGTVAENNRLLEKMASTNLDSLQ